MAEAPFTSGAGAGVGAGYKPLEYKPCEWITLKTIGESLSFPITTVMETPAVRQFLPPDVKPGGNYYVPIPHDDVWKLLRPKYVEQFSGIIKSASGAGTAGGAVGAAPEIKNWSDLRKNIKKELHFCQKNGEVIEKIQDVIKQFHQEHKLGQWGFDVRSFCENLLKGRRVDHFFDYLPEELAKALFAAIVKTFLGL